MSLTNPIRPYDPDWPRQYAAEATRLEPIFGAALVGLHHVGSTAVPELAAKGEIDVLAVVTSENGLDQWSQSLAALGYRRGRDLSANHSFFKRDVNGVRTHKLHVCRVGHEQIVRMLRFRDHLRKNAEDRLKYQELKLTLERENATGIQEYLRAKDPFIQNILTKFD